MACNVNIIKQKTDIYCNSDFKKKVTILQNYNKPPKFNEYEPRRLQFRTDILSIFTPLSQSRSLYFRGRSITENEATHTVILRASEYIKTIINTFFEIEIDGEIFEIRGVQRLDDKRSILKYIQVHLTIRRLVGLNS